MLSFISIILQSLIIDMVILPSTLREKVRNDRKPALYHGGKIKWLKHLH